MMKAAPIGLGTLEHGGPDGDRRFLWVAHVYAALALEAPDASRTACTVWGTGGHPHMGLKVGIVTEYYYPLLGGVSENVHNTAVQLMKLGHDVQIITSRHSGVFGPDGDHPAQAGPPVVRIGRSLPVYANGSIANVTVGMRLWKRLSTVVRQGGFDVVHVHSPIVFTLPPLAVLAAPCPTFATFHTYFEGSAVYRAFAGVLQKQFLDRVHGNIVVSRSCLEALQKYFTLDARVVPNGVDVNEFSPAVPRLPQYDSGKLNLLFLSRFDPRNGLGFMLQAFDIVHEQFAGVRLIVVGDGPLRQHYERQVPERLAPDVHFVGPALGTRRNYYATCDVYCSPITKASFGVTLLEAMASGKPIVATENEGYRDLLGPEEGILVPRGDPRVFAEAILRLLRDPALRAQMGQKGREKSAAFSWDSVTRQLVGFYEEILDARSWPRSSESSRS